MKNFVEEPIGTDTKKGKKKSELAPELKRISRTPFERATIVTAGSGGGGRQIQYVGVPIEPDRLAEMNEVAHTNGINVSHSTSVGRNITVSSTGEIDPGARFTFQAVSPKKLGFGFGSEEGSNDENSTPKLPTDPKIVVDFSSLSSIKNPTILDDLRTAGALLPNVPSIPPFEPINLHLGSFEDLPVRITTSSTENMNGHSSEKRRVKKPPIERKRVNLRSQSDTFY